MKQIVCMKWGDRYSADYVNRLYGMARRHTTGELRVVCLTDDPRGVRREVACRPCPSIDVPDPHRNCGWRKVTLFARQLDGLEGEVLFLDLDVVVTGDLDPLFEHGQSLVIMKNWTQPGQRIGNTSVYRFRVGQHPEVLETLLSDPMRHIREHHNSQTYISRTLGERMSFWPDPWCISFKTHCLPPWPARLWREPGLPPDAKVVIFPGKPDPEEAARGRWPAPWHKRLYKTTRPTRWVQERWQA